MARRQFGRRLRQFRAFRAGVPSVRSASFALYSGIFWKAVTVIGVARDTYKAHSENEYLCLHQRWIDGSEPKSNGAPPKLLMPIRPIFGPTKRRLRVIWIHL